MAAACILASAKGTTNSSLFDSGATLKVKDNVATLLDKCLPWYDALCLTGTG